MSTKCLIKPQFMPLLITLIETQRHEYIEQIYLRFLFIDVSLSYIWSLSMGNNMFSYLLALIVYKLSINKINYRYCI